MRCCQAGKNSSSITEGRVTLWMNLPLSCPKLKRPNPTGLRDTRNEVRTPTLSIKWTNSSIRNLRKFSREKGSVNRSYILLKGWIFQSPRNLYNPLMTLMHLKKRLTDEAQARTRIIYSILNIVKKWKKLRQVFNYRWMHWFKF